MLFIYLNYSFFLKKKREYNINAYNFLNHSFQQFRYLIIINLYDSYVHE